MSLRPRRLMVLALLAGWLGMASSTPASAKIFTIDGNGNGLNDPGGADDLAFSFMGATGLASGSFRAVDLDADLIDIQNQLDRYVDVTGIVPPENNPDFAEMDLLIFDLTLDLGSAAIELLTTRVDPTVPAGVDPIGAGWLEDCAPEMPLPEGCAYFVPNGLTPKSPNNVYLPDDGSAFAALPGSTIFEFGKIPPSHNPFPNNLNSGETTVRLFVAWEDTGPQTPLSKDGQNALFSLASGGVWSGEFAGVNIVPEPATALLLGLGIVTLARVPRSRRSTRI